VAENTVVKEYLSPEMIEAGAQLITKLDAMGLPMSAALWLFDDEINEWRLLIASPEREKSGSRSIYEKIQEARRALGDKAAAAPMSLITLVDPNQELIRAFREGMPTGEGISRLRFTKRVVNRRYVDDALIYRIA
jgi:hypothetical protein